MGTRSSNCNNKCLKLKNEFLLELKEFHQAFGTPFSGVLKINGNEIDLYNLYNSVVSLGGSEKVESTGSWWRVLCQVNLPRNCVNGPTAVKSIYYRYLRDYEILHVSGKSKCDEEFEKDNKAKFVLLLPMSYDQRQHYVTDYLRLCKGFSKDLHKSSAYEKLSLSLISPLPNEQDFAINVCAFLSNRRINSKISKDSQLINFLLAHAGVFKDDSLYVLFHKLYDVDRNHPLTQFWKSVTLNSGELNSTQELFNNTTDYNIHLDYFDPFVFERVKQVSQIVCNLTFNPSHVAPLAKNETFQTFLLLCFKSKFQFLRKIGWDILCNTIADIPEEPNLIKNIIEICTTEFLFGGRNFLVDALQVLSNLVASDFAHKYFLSYLSVEFIKRLCFTLTEGDGVLIIVILELIYSLSQSREKVIDYIIDKQLFDILISLLTVDVQNTGVGEWGKVRLINAFSKTDISDNPRILTLPQHNLPQTTSPCHKQPEPHCNGIIDTPLSCRQLNKETNIDSQGLINISSVFNVLNSDGYLPEISSPKNSLVPVKHLKPTPIHLEEKKPTSIKSEQKPTGHSLCVNQININQKNVSSCEQPLKLILDCAAPQQKKVENPVCTRNKRLLPATSSESASPIKIRKLVVDGQEFLAETITVGSKCYLISRSQSSKDNNAVNNNQKPEHQKTDARAILRSLLAKRDGSSCSAVSNNLQCEDSKFSYVDLDSSKPSPAKQPEGPPIHLCEWRGCMRNFKTVLELYNHICSVHCPASGNEERCLWPKCDERRKTRFSLLSHVYKDHCVIKQDDKNAPKKAKEVAVIEEIKLSSSCSPNCVEEVAMTQCIRLTTALILKNTASQSRRAIKYLMQYENILLDVAINNTDCSKIISEILSLVSMSKH